MHPVQPAVIPKQKTPEIAGATPERATTTTHEERTAALDDLLDKTETPQAPVVHSVQRSTMNFIETAPGRRTYTIQMNTGEGTNLKEAKKTERGFLIAAIQNAIRE
jgi:hypothetical protein